MTIITSKPIRTFDVVFTGEHAEPILNGSRYFALFGSGVGLERCVEAFLRLMYGIDTYSTDLTYTCRSDPGIVVISFASECVCVLAEVRDQFDPWLFTRTFLDMDED